MDPELIQIKAMRVKEEYVQYLAARFRARSITTDFAKDELAELRHIMGTATRPGEPVPTSAYLPSSNSHVHFVFSPPAAHEAPEVEPRGTAVPVDLMDWADAFRVQLMRAVTALLDQDIQDERRSSIWAEEEENVEKWTLRNKAALVAKYRLMDECFPPSFPITVLSVCSLEGTAVAQTTVFSAGLPFAQLLDTLDSLHRAPTFGMDDPRIREIQLERLRTLVDRGGRSDDRQSILELMTRLEHRLPEYETCSTQWQCVPGVPGVDGPMNMAARPIEGEEDYRLLAKTAKEGLSTMGFTFMQKWQMRLRDANALITLFERRSEWHETDFTSPPSASPFDAFALDETAPWSDQLPEHIAGARLIQGLRYLGDAADESPQLAARIDAFFGELGLTEQIEADDSADAGRAVNNH